MDDDRGEGRGPEGDGEQESHLLIVGLRIALVSLLVIVGILIVGRIVVAKADLKSSGADTSAIGGPVPVSPITTQPSPLPTDVAVPSSDNEPNLPSLSPQPAPTDIPPEDSVPPGLVLSISPTTVSSGQSFTVSGTYAGRDGVTLQLQVLENGVWNDYPNDIEVSMGTYSTVASSTVPGTNSFRVYDQTENVASNVVTVLVR